MKKTVMTNIKTLAAIFVAAATFTACSSESDNEITSQQILPNENYLLSVTATKGGGAEYTRALTIDPSNANKIKATWNHTTEHVYVKYKNGSAAYAWCQNALTPSASGQTANLVGYLRGSDFQEGTKLKLFFPNNKNERTYEGQIGTLGDIAANFDYQESSELVIDGVSGNAIALKDLSGVVTFTPQQAIAKFALKDKGNSDAALSATKLVVKVGDTEYTINPTSATDVMYVAIPGFSGQNVKLTATVGSYTYTCDVSGVTFVNGKYYSIEVKMTKPTDLSTITVDYEAKNGETLTGTLTHNVKISIADGATVTLDGVTIDPHDYDYPFAGLTCSGDATIILEGANTVKGFDANYPGIYVPENKTLTIQGTGSLTARSNNDGAGIGGGTGIAACGNIVINSGTVTATGGNSAAGIGGGNSGSCGYITINGGNITATGGGFGAGIGGGFMGTCGDITINGGTVSATGGDNAAGIGGGWQNGSCGTITIKSGVTSVTATKGTGATNSIGAGKGGTSVTVTIEDPSKVTQN